MLSVLPAVPACALKVAASCGQLDAVGRLLQEYRRQLAAAHAAGQLPAHPSGLLLLGPDALDELLFLLLAQASYCSGDWRGALGLFRQLRSERGGGGFAAHNGPLHGALIELLVVRGGVEGTMAAVAIVDDCHAAGVLLLVAHGRRWGVCLRCARCACTALAPCAPACGLHCGYLCVC